jgi:hypothetical protein
MSRLGDAFERSPRGKGLHSRQCMWRKTAHPISSSTGATQGASGVLMLPLAVIDQVILEAAEAHAVPAEHIAGFEALA